MIPFENGAEMRTRSRGELLVVTMLLAAPGARGRAAAPPSGNDDRGPARTRIGENHFKFIGRRRVERGDVEDLRRRGRSSSGTRTALVATGNVVLRQGNNRIAADRADFNTKTRLGTLLQRQRHRQRPAAAPDARLPASSRRPRWRAGHDVYFFGETVEKIGPRKYKITNGGFTTCVQPTPRWDLHADTIVLNLDHYTLLKQVVLNVKGVPMLYLPVLYYPTKRGGSRDRDFCSRPTASSTLRGQSLHNAFFWAINRSQDATILHDWFSKTGQGVGSEYRYNFGGGSDGNLRAYLLDQHATTALHGT